MKVAGYLRVSSADQVEGYSLDAQARALESYCAGRGWARPTLYVEPGVSAYTDVTEARPAFSAMLAAAERGQHDIVVVHKLDRFARSVQVTLRELQRLDKAGVAFASISEAIDFTTPIGRVMLTMLAAFAQYYSDNLSTEVKKGLDEKRASGKHIGGIPFGALRLADGTLAIDPATAGALRELLARAAAEGDSRAATALNVAGYRGKRGGPWRTSNVRAAILHGDWLLDQPDPWPALYAAARTRPRQPAVNVGVAVRLLTGLMHCPCGGRAYYAGRDRRGQPCIQCRHYSRDRPNGLRCPHRKRMSGYYDDAVTRWFLALPDLRGAVRAPLPDLASARAELARRRRTLWLGLDAGALPEAEYRARLAALAAEEARLPLADGQPERLAAHIRLIQEGWHTLTLAQRNAALRGIVDRVILDGDTCTIEPVPALAALLAVAGDPAPQ